MIAMPYIKASPEGLKQINQAITKISGERGWAKYDEDWSEEASKLLPKSSTLNGEVQGSVSRATWNRFLGGKQRIKAVYFKAFCDLLGLNFEEIADSPKNKIPPTEESQATTHISDNLQDWGDAPNVSNNFFGRTSELSLLEKWIIEDKCRLVGIVGFGGVGKTSMAARFRQGGIGKSELSAKFARNFHNNFDRIIWRSLINELDFTELVSDLIKFLSGNPDVNLADSVEEQISQLLNYLKENRCLIILDNFETIIQRQSSISKYREGFESYGKLIKQIGNTTHESCLVITSREKPQELLELNDCEETQNKIQILELSGLKTSDVKNIFETKGVFTVSSEDEWETLTKMYGGNPLCLTLLTKIIIDIFESDISAFLQQDEYIFDKIENVINWHFNRLSKSEKDVMCWLAINREPVSILQLKKDFLLPEAQKRITRSFSSLLDNSLIEKKDSSYTLQPVVMEFITEYLVTKFTKEFTAETDIDIIHDYALFKCSSKEYIRNIQKKIFILPIKESAISCLRSQDNLESKFENILQKIRNEKIGNLSYASGNILNFLCQIESDLNGWNFSNTNIYQADLQGANLYNVNFSNCNFINCSFLHIFDSVLAIATSRNQNLLAVSYSFTGDIDLWNIDTFQNIQTLKGHNANVCSIEISHDNKIIASASDDGSIKLWYLESKICQTTLNVDNSGVRSISFSPDNSILASGHFDCKVRLWDVRDIKNVELLCTLEEHTEWLLSVKFSNDGKLLASAGGDNKIILWDAETYKLKYKLEGHSNTVLSSSFNCDDSVIVTCGHDGKIKLWDTESGTLIKTLHSDSSTVWSVAFDEKDPDKLISGHDDGKIKVWNIRNKNPLNILQGHTSFISKIIWDQKLIVSGSDDGTIRLWTNPEGQCLITLRGYSNKTWSIKFSPSTQILVSSHEDKCVRLWELKNGNYEYKKSLIGHLSKVYAVDISRDGRTIVSASFDKTIKVWDSLSGTCIQTLKGHTKWVVAVALSPDGRTIASGSDDKKVMIWDCATGQLRHILEGHTSLITSLTFSADGKMLASCNPSHTVGESQIILWNVSSGKRINTNVDFCSSLMSIAFSRIDKNIFATGHGNSEIILWKIKETKSVQKNIQEIECIKSLKAHSKAITSICFHPTNELVLASASTDNTVGIWNIETGNCKIFSEHSDRVMSVSFNIDGSILASCSDDKTIKLWNPETGECTQTITVDPPYKGMNITGSKFPTASERKTLLALGAVDDSEFN